MTAAFKLAAIFALASVFSQIAAQEGASRLKSHGLKNFPAHYIAAVDAYYDAEKKVRSGKYAEALARLDAFWLKYPQGDAMWHQVPQQAGGIFTGHPPAYTALTMLTKIARQFAASKPQRKEILQMTVVLVKSATGNDPRTVAEAANNQGTPRQLTLDGRIAAGDFKAIRESTWLVTEYLSALMGGAVQIRQKFVYLPKTIELVNSSLGQGGVLNTFGGKSYEQFWAAIGQTKLIGETDFWFIVHPSNIPSLPEVRNGTYLARGGMGHGPAGSPCMVVDDLFLLQASPHFKVNEKPFTLMEQQLYLPQFYQHEIFHYIFSKYQEFSLETKPHQWHDRKAWPADFQGTFESDYYSEAIEKRIATAAKPLVAHFRYQAPPARLWKTISPESLVGEYHRNPVQNDWHVGHIKLENGKFLWQNRAGAKWDLIYNGNGEFLTNESNPYYKGGNPAGRSFRLIIPRDAEGKFRPEVTGFSFNNETYERQR